jgi:acyl-coenzyme A thioesterase PaaI-like protein
MAVVDGAPPDPTDLDPARALAEARRLADEVRRIINRLVLVRPPAQDSAAAADAASEFAARLESMRRWEVSGVDLEPREFAEHSPLSGRSNPLSPPIETHLVETPDGGYYIAGTVTFGAAYQGPPGHCHGGLVAAMFDDLLGFAQLSAGFTGTLTVRYRKPTPLHEELTLKAWPHRIDGRKRIIKGTCHLGDTLLSEAEGLFVAPRDGDYKRTLGLT